MIDVENRMVDFGVDAFWLSHEPWIVPEPFTPEAGELWSKEDVDLWIDVLAQVIDEAYEDPEVVKTAPHNQAIHQVLQPRFTAIRLFTNTEGWVARPTGSDIASDAGSRTSS